MLICLWAGYGHAQDTTAEQKAELLKFAANNNAFDDRVEAMGRELFRRQKLNCGPVDQALRQLPTPYGSITFPADPKGTFPAPLSGLWIEHVKIRACDKVLQTNMLVVARKNDEPLIFALLPGDTLSDPSAQGEAERVGAMTIKKADESCLEDAKAFYTRQLGFRQASGGTGKKDQGLGWFEEWTYTACEKVVPVQMVFLPKPAGGYEIKARMTAEGVPQAPSKPAQP